MTIKGYIRAAVVAAGVFTIAAPAMAQEVADMHEQRRERGVICFTDHYHYGSSSGQPTKRAAQIAAIQSWAGFVDFEYGGVLDELGKVRKQEHQVFARGSAWRLELRCKLEAVPPLMPSGKLPTVVKAGRSPGLFACHRSSSEITGSLRSEIECGVRSTPASG